MRGWVIGAVFSIVGTTIAIQFGWLGPSLSFVQNLLTTAAIWIGSRVIAKVISKY